MMATSLSSVFSRLTDASPDLTQSLWKEIEQHYSEKSRYYHNLQHLQNMYEQLLQVKETIDDWETLLFALFYHDIIYSSTVKDNEERSAVFAKKSLQQIGYPVSKIQRCVDHILATKSHVLSTDNDTNYFTDTDLSILGAPWPEYEAYTKAIRKEYSIYPDLLYRPGRRKVLQHFLGMEIIYKTPHFQHGCEAAARENLKREWELLA